MTQTRKTEETGYYTSSGKKIYHRQRPWVDLRIADVCDFKLHRVVSCLRIAVLVIFALLRIAEPVSAARTSVEQLTTEGALTFDDNPLMEKVEAVKLDVLQLNLEILNKKIFVESNFSVFFGLDLVHPYVVESVRLYLDGKIVRDNTFNQEKRRLVSSGAAERIYFDNLEKGEHFLEIELKGSEHGRKLTRKNGVHFNKEERPVFIDIHIQDHDKMPPELIKVIHYTPFDILRMDEVNNVLLKNYAYYINKRDYLKAATVLRLAYEVARKRDPYGKVRFLMAKTYISWNLLDKGEELFTNLTEEFSSGTVYFNSLYYLQVLSLIKKQTDNVFMYQSKITKNSNAPLRLIRKSNYLAGETYLNISDYQKALKSFQSIAFEDENYPYALFNMFNAYYEQDDFDRMEKVLLNLKNHLKERPRKRQYVDLSDQVQKSLAFLYLEAGRYDDALNVFNQIEKKSIFADEVIFGIGWAYLYKQEFVKAIIMFKDLFEKFPHSSYTSEGLMLTGYSYTRLTSYDKAVALFNDVISHSKQKMEKINDFQISMVESRFTNYILSSIISTNTTYSDYIKDNDTLFVEFPELLENVKLMSVMNQFKEFVYIELFLEDLFQDVVEMETESIFKNGVFITDRPQMEHLLSGTYLNSLIRQVRSVKTEYFVMLNKKLKRELNNIKNKYSKHVLEATVRITSNLIHDTHGILPQLK